MRSRQHRTKSGAHNPAGRIGPTLGTAAVIVGIIYSTLQTPPMPKMPSETICVATRSRRALKLASAWGSGADNIPDDATPGTGHALGRCCGRTPAFAELTAALQRAAKRMERPLAMNRRLTALVRSGLACFNPGGGVPAMRQPSPHSAMHTEGPRRQPLRKLTRRALAGTRDRVPRRVLERRSRRQRARAGHLTTDALSADP